VILAAVTLAALHLLPRPQRVAQIACTAPYRFQRPLRVAEDFDAGAIDEIDERWKALGLPGVVRVAANPDIRVERRAMAPQSYALQTADGGRVTILAGDRDGAFYAAMTLAQLPVRVNGRMQLPCVTASDAPAMRWRILSDDVSRGPLPNMRYFKERIRTVAAFKMNGYSPYMEHVVVVPSDPLPAPLDGITTAQLHELWEYAARYHVTFIVQQQTFAHMHNTLRYEEYASAAETPHAFLLSPASQLSLPYLDRVIRAELAVIPHPPFFHIGSDETSALGQGQSKVLAQQMGLSQLYAQHVRQMNDIIKPSGARLMLWDDGIENDPKIMRLIPRSAVVVNWHYGNEKTFVPYINLLRSGGFEQMIDPGDSNWNQIYPDIRTALAVENRFITEGKNANVLGLYESTWHDDGESLFEATWYPVIYAGVSAWERSPVDEARYRRDFPQAFFGTDDARYGADFEALADVQSTMAQSYDYSSDYLMWADPFDPLFQAHMKALDVRALRLKAESVETHLLAARPPLHANAARVMFLAARKYDFIGRKYQAAQEIRDEYYGPNYRGLAWSKYWFWELRDGYEELEPLYASAWRYENRESHLGSNLERYHLAAQRNIARADRVYDATLKFGTGKTLVPLEDILRR
jgi:hexosaminidase